MHAQTMSVFLERLVGVFIPATEFLWCATAIPLSAQSLVYSVFLLISLVYCRSRQDLALLVLVSYCRSRQDLICTGMSTCRGGLKDLPLAEILAKQQARGTPGGTPSASAKSCSEREGVP